MSNYFLIVVLDKIYKLKVTNIPSLLTPHFQLKDKLEKQGKKTKKLKIDLNRHFEKI